MRDAACLSLPIGIVLCWLNLAAGEGLYDESTIPVLQLKFSQANWWQQLQANYQSKTNLPATLTVDGIAYEGVGVRFRGNTSYQMTGTSQKKSFNIEIDYTIAGQSLMGYETLNLINCASDATFMREVLYSNTCRQQIPSAKANFVRLEINGENWGIYANVQQLNGDFIRDWFLSNDGTRWRAQGDMGGGGGVPGGRTPPGGTTPVTPVTPNVPPRTTTGEITVAEFPGGGGGGVTNGVAALTWQGTASTAYERVYELKNSAQADPWASLIHVCDVLNNTALAQLPEKLEPVLNVDRALWVCAFEIIFQDDDGYVNKRGSDYCLYYEPETGRMHLMQYDGNESMNMTGTGWSVFYRADDPVVPVMNRLMAVPQYRQRYLAHVRTILDSFFTEEGLSAKIDAYRALIENEVKADTKKLYTTQAFTSGLETLKSFVRSRRASILANAEVKRPVPRILAVTQDTAQREAGQTITVTAYLSDAVAVSSVQLFVSPGPFVLFTPMAMTDAGHQGEGAASEHIFRLTLPDYPAGTVLRYYVQAMADDGLGTVVFDPPCAEHEVYACVVTYPHPASSAVVINEIMARNKSAIADPQGEYDDWIELKNVSDQALDLSGMYLSDSAINPLKWQFPQGTELGPGGYLIIWADEDGGDQPGLHASFKLSSGGETVWLYDTAARGYALLDAAAFEDLAADQSCARYPDGTGPMQTASAPSPLTTNAAPATTGGK